MSTDNPGKALLDALRREVLSALEQAARDVIPDLAGLAPDPAFADTPYDGLVLGKVQTAHPVLAVLQLLSFDQPPVSAALHGWRDTTDAGAPRGVAYVVRTAAAGVVALSVVPDGGPHLATLRASGGLSGPLLQGQLDGGFLLTVSGSTTDAMEVGFSLDQPPQVVALRAGSHVELAVERTGAGDRLGPDSGPSVLFGTLAAGLSGGADAAGAFEAHAHLTLSKGEVVLAPDFLAAFVPIPTHYPLDFSLKAEPGTGVTLNGSPSLRLRLGGTEDHWLDLVSDVVADAAAPALRLGFRTSLVAGLPGAPVELQVDGLGFDLPLSLKLGTPLLPDPAALRPALPSGIGADLQLPVLTGTGKLMHVGNDIVGAISVRIPPMSASAFVVLSPEHQTEHGTEPMSFLAILGATFPPPGIQIGFGFAITGVGGMVGINRRVDRDALTSAVADGTAAQLLFPADPVAAGEDAVAALPAIFPAKRGSVVAGPMFQIGWGGRMVEASVAVLAEISSQVRITILGKVVVAIPDPAAPLIYLQATFAGFIDPAEPSVMFVASLTGSRVVGASLSGDMLVLTRGGSDAAMVVSAGGFHPSYVPPRGVPALDRVQLDLCPTPLIQLRCDAYFAVTSNTLQFGAELELIAEVAECGLRGWFSFDALIQIEPFRFVADIAGGVSLRVFGETLMGIALALHLEGPAPYLARGRGSIDLFLFEVSFDFEVGWGSPPPPAVSARDVGADLRAALAAPAAWRAQGQPCPGVLLTRSGTKRLESGAAVDPYGFVSVNQAQVPLGLEIQEYGGVPVPPQRWDIVGGSFRYDDNARTPVEPAQSLEPLRNQFAPGLYLTQASDDQALGGQAFVTLDSGALLRAQPAVEPEPRTVAVTWEDKVQAPDLPAPIWFDWAAILDSLVLPFGLSLAVDDPVWWERPATVVSVAAEPPVVAASTAAMALVDVGAEATSLVEVAQAVAASDFSVMTLEAWELA